VNTMIMLLRREFWEHRSLWIAPLVVAAVLLIVMMFGNVNNGRSVAIDLGDASTPEQVERALERELEGIDQDGREALQALRALEPAKKRSIYAVVMASFAMIQGVVLAIVLFFYLLDALYSERRDRSILFWKSMPVSDNATVLSKALIGLCVAPLLAIAITAVTQLLFAGIWSVRFGDSMIGGIFPAFDLGVWLRIQWTTLVASFVGALWWAPVVGYLLLVSAWARKNPFLWAVLPPVVLMMVEELLLNTNYVVSFVAHRAVGFVSKFDLGSKFGDADKADEISGAVPTVGSVFDGIGAGQVFASPDLWLGLVVAGALLFAASRLRRYRDETAG
jgi:ABC-2 type transport system permease protein